MAEAKRALRPASFQLFSLFPINADGELASAEVNRPKALRPNELFAIVVAYNLSKSPVCSRPDGGEAIAQPATLGSLPKSVAAQSSGDGNQGQNESIDGLGKNTDIKNSYSFHAHVRSCC